MSQAGTVGSGSSGDVVGPASSTTNDIALFADTTGKTLKDSNVSIDSTGTITGVFATASSTGITYANSSTGNVMVYMQVTGAAADSYTDYVGSANDYKVGTKNADGFFYISQGGAGSLTTANAILKGTTVAVQATKGFAIAVKQVAVTSTATTSDNYIGVTSTSSGRTITLPTTGLLVGQTFTVKDESGAAATNNVILSAGGTVQIDGATTYTINTNYGSVTVVWNGTKYSII